MSEKLFDGQREGEEVKFTFRRHFATAKKGVIWLILMILLGCVPMWVWQGDGRMFWVFLVFVVVGLIGFFYAYMMWYFSIYIVTDQRIRQVSQKGLFKKSVVDLGFDKIQSISYGVPGVRAGIMGYGTILIQTGVGDLTISNVKDAAGIHNELRNIMEESRE